MESLSTIFIYLYFGLFFCFKIIKFSSLRTWLFHISLITLLLFSQKIIHLRAFKILADNTFCWCNITFSMFSIWERVTFRILMHCILTNLAHYLSFESVLQSVLSSGLRCILHTAKVTSLWSTIVLLYCSYSLIEAIWR